MNEATIYHLAARADWERAQDSGAYAGSPNDLRDGFIHFSSAAQVKESAAKHRAGRRDQLLLFVDAAVLGDALKWEPARNGDLFPHLYGALPVAAVRRVEALPLGPDGAHIFPELSQSPSPTG